MVEKQNKKTIVTLYLLYVFLFHHISCRSRVVFLCVSSLPCFCTYYRSISTWNEVFFKNYFPKLCAVWGFLNQLPKRTCFTSKYDITLQMNLLITSNKVFCAEDVYTFGIGDEHFSAGDEMLKIHVQLSDTHTATCSYTCTSNFQTELTSRRLLVTALHTSENRRYHAVEIQRYLDVQRLLLLHKLAFKTK